MGHITHAAAVGLIGTLLAGLGGLTEAQAGALTDCAVLSREALDVALEAENTTIQELTLKRGDLLTFRFETASVGPFGSLTLRQAAGAPRALLLGPSGTSVDFAPGKPGTFEFEFAKEGPEPAQFSVSCAPAGRGQAATAGAGRSTARRAAKLLGGSLEDIEPSEMDDPAGMVLEAAAPARAPAPAAESRPLNVVVLPPPDLKMQWRGEGGAAADAGHTGAGHTGIDAAFNYKPVPDIMVGALAQIDEHGRTVTPGVLESADQAWMVGPVAAVKLAPNLSLDARAAWGVAESAPDPLAAHSISTPRREVSARLVNTQAYGAWRFAPSISVNHFQETAVTASSGPDESATSHTTGSGRVEMGPEVAYRIDVDKSVFVEPRAAIGSFWDIESLSNLSPGDAGHGDMRLKAEAGVTVGAMDGTKLQAGGGVEEGAPGESNVWSGRLQLSVPIK